MGSIYRQKGNGPNWVIKYYRDGRPVIESTRTDDRKKAARILRDREAAIDNGMPIGPTIGRVRFDEGVTDLLNDYAATGKTSGDDIERRIRKHLTPVFGGRRLSTITGADISAYIAQRLKETYRVRAAVVKRLPNGRTTIISDEKRRPYSKAQVNRELMALNRIFTLAIQNGKLLYKPHVPKLAEDNVREGFFDVDQFEAVCAHLPAEIQAVVTFAYITGWRIDSEVLPLEWRQVDFASGEVRLDRGTATKNRQGRVFVMTDELRWLLNDQHAAHLALKKAGEIAPWVFVRMVADRRRGPKHPRPITRFEKTWKAACVAAGCPGRIPHDLRRSAVRNMVRAGVPERVAMKLTGHKTRSVFERYNIVSDDDLASAAVRLSGQFARRRNAASQDV